MKLGNLKIGLRLTIGFGLVIFLIIISLAISLVNINTLRTLTSDMYEHPLAVSNAVREIDLKVIKIRELISLMIYNRKSVDSLSKQIDSLEISVYEDIQIVRKQYLGDQSDIELLAVAFGNMKRSREKVIEAIRADKIDEAYRLMIERKHVILAYEKEIKEIRTFSGRKSGLFFENAKKVAENITLFTMFFALFLVILGVVIAYFMTISIKKPLSLILTGVKRIESGDFINKIDVNTKDEVGTLAITINETATSLEQLTEETKLQDWFKTGLNTLNEKMRGDLQIEAISDNVINFLCNYLNAKVGAFYLFDESDQVLTLTGSYAFTKRKKLNDKINIKEGLVGQCAYTGKQIVLTNLPDDYTHIGSAIGEALPKNVIVSPVIQSSKIIGVIELGSFDFFSNKQIEFLEDSSESIGIAVSSAMDRTTLHKLLKKTQNQAEELQSQQEELKASNQALEVQQEELKAANEELQEQSSRLKISEEKLRSQQEELEVTNEELEEKNESLQRQKAEIQTAREELEIKAEELSIASKYKSEFLANMSHELRTPLNSLLILSKILSDNKEGNLSQDQIESATVIYRSGNDLLILINEILDLSKIEAGRMQLNYATVPIEELTNNLQASFKPLVEVKGLTLKISVSPDSPKTIEIDKQRLEQVLKNLMSNAIKFTKTGEISVQFANPTKGVNLFRSGLKYDNSLAISVKDTGIGIPANKLKVIFEAFQQADGSTSREYGGTGLGLSISRELAHLLGGEIQLESVLNKGSIFTLFVPLNKLTDSSVSDINSLTDSVQVVKEANIIEKLNKKLPTKTLGFTDDRNTIKKGDRVILIIEDDANFAKLLFEESRAKSFKAIVAISGEDGLELTSQYMPDAIILDLGLPGISGWSVLENLKENSKTRHIPVHIISADDLTLDAYRKGAIGYFTKPLQKEEMEEAFTKLEEFTSDKIKDLLIIEDDTNLQLSISKLIADSDVKITPVSSGKDAILAITKTSFDCIILDLGLPDMTGFELLQTLGNMGLNIPPIIVYTGRELSKSEEAELRNYANSIIIKGVRSEERLLDEVSLFLHRLVKKMPEQKRKMILNLHETDNLFKDKKLLIVDDDMRNVFALSKILSERGFKLLKAEDGKKALDILEKEPDIDIVLMDIMMPVMDGYEAIKRIREQEKFYNLPIIAITAKAMKKDYEQCISVGASDYLSKPIDISRLISMMRVWLYR